MDSETFQRVMYGYADTPQEQVLNEMMHRNPALFFQKWQEAIDAEQRPVEVVNCSMFSHEDVSDTAEIAAQQERQQEGAA